MSKFLDFLGEPKYLSNGQWAVAQEAMTKDEFLAFIRENYNPSGELEGIEEDWMHYHIGYDDDGERVNWWWTGCGHIKNSKPVWTY